MGGGPCFSHCLQPFIRRFSVNDKKDCKWKQICVLTPASAGAGDPDSQAYARGAWLSRGTLGSRPGVMELISTVVNDLYDGSGVQRLQPSLHKADHEEWHSQRGAALRSHRGQQMTSRQLFGKAGGSPGWVRELLRHCTGQDMLLARESREQGREDEPAARTSGSDASSAGLTSHY